MQTIESFLKIKQLEATSVEPFISSLVAIKAWLQERLLEGPNITSEEFLSSLEHGVNEVIDVNTSFNYYFGGLLYIVESKEDLNQIGSPYPLPDEATGHLATNSFCFDVAEKLGNCGILFCDITNDAGGPSYFIPTHLINNHVKDSFNITNLEAVPMKYKNAEFETTNNKKETLTEPEYNPSIAEIAEYANENGLGQEVTGSRELLELVKQKMIAEKEISTLKDSLTREKESLANLKEEDNKLRTRSDD